MLTAEVLETMLYRCVTWSMRVCHYYTLRRSQHSSLTCCISWRKNDCTEHTIFYLQMVLKTRGESINASIRRRWILFEEFVARMDKRLPKSVMFGELVGARAPWGVGKRVDEVFP